MRRKDREITGINEIEAIISHADICRVALTYDNIPYIVPMNFGYSGGVEKKLYFHCAPEGRKIEMIKKNSYACFELDTDHNITEGKEACDFSMKYSSVIGWGNIFIINNNEEKLEGLNSIMHHYTKRRGFKYYPEVLNKTIVLRLDIITMTGKKT
jgi:uncharacterized protein